MEDSSTYKFLERLQELHHPKKSDVRKELLDKVLSTNYYALMNEYPVFANEILGSNLSPTVEEIQIAIANYIEKQRKFVYAVPTQYENAYHYSIIKDLANDVEVAIADLGLKLETNVVLGTLPTGSIDGMTLLDPSNDNLLIIIESGVFTFADLFSQVIARCLVKESLQKPTSFSWQGEYYKEIISEDLGIIEEFEDTLEACVFFGDPAAPISPQKYWKKAFMAGLNYDPSKDGNDIKKEIKSSQIRPMGKNTKSIASILRWVVETFIIAHEYGHIINGDNKTDIYSKDILDTNKTYNIIKRKWMEEYGADSFALKLVLHIGVKKGFNPTLVIWGIELFFSLIATIDKGICFFTQLEYKNFYPSTILHPLPQLRFGFLHHLLNEGREKDDKFHPALDQMLISKIVDELWDKFMFSSGLFGVINKRKIAPRWNYKLKGDHHVIRETIGFKPFDINKWLEENQK